jgi:hypothetical protein
MSTSKEKCPCDSDSACENEEGKPGVKELVCGAGPMRLSQTQLYPGMWLRHFPKPYVATGQSDPSQVT